MNYHKIKTTIPFIGSKWKYRNKLYDILTTHFDTNKEYLIYDIFGGSGSLSLICKDIFKNSKIIFNDYDEIITDKQNNNVIDEQIDKANNIINEIKQITNYNETRNNKLNNTELIKNILDKHNADLKNITKSIVESQICFNSRSLKDNQKDYFNRIRKTDVKHYYDNFKGIQIIHKDFEDIFSEIPNDENIIILLDPPYLNTQMNGKYKMNYWKFNKYLKMLSFIVFNQKIKFILFEGKESNINDILDFISEITQNDKLKEFKHFELSKNEFVNIIN